MPRKHAPKDNPLYKLSLPELETEYQFRKAICYACDKDDQDIHTMLQSNLREATRVLHCRKNNLPLDEENTD